MSWIEVAAYVVTGIGMFICIATLAFTVLFVGVTIFENWKGDGK